MISHALYVECNKTIKGKTAGLSNSQRAAITTNSSVERLTNECVDTLFGHFLKNHDSRMVPS